MFSKMFSKIGRADNSGAAQALKNNALANARDAGVNSGIQTALRREGLTTAKQAMWNPVVNAAGMAGVGGMLGAANPMNQYDTATAAKNGATAGALVGAALSGGRLASRLARGQIVGSESISAMRAGVGTNQLRRIGSVGELLTDGITSKTGEEMISRLGGNINTGIGKLSSKANSFASNVDSSYKRAVNQRGINTASGNRVTGDMRNKYSQRVSSWTGDVKSSAGWYTANKQVHDKFANSIKNNMGAQNSWMGNTLSSMNSAIKPANKTTYSKIR